jgi:deazaflavin-dependent oxidoreductase (nitroreductase family)
VRVDGPVGRVVQKVAGSAAFARVAPKVVPPMDKVLHRLSGGRFVLSAALLPSLVLTTTGAKSGEPREAPLATLPVEGGFLVVGSNFGREKHPAWTGNLLKNPEATVSYKGQRIPVTARLLDDDEKEAVWPQLTTLWPTYDRYVERSGRNLRVFRLERRHDQT